MQAQPSSAQTPSAVQTPGDTAKAPEAGFVRMRGYAGAQTHEGSVWVRFGVTHYAIGQAKCAFISIRATAGLVAGKSTSSWLYWFIEEKLVGSCQGRKLNFERQITHAHRKLVEACHHPSCQSIMLVQVQPSPAQKPSAVQPPGDTTQAPEAGFARMTYPAVAQYLGVCPK